MTSKKSSLEKFYNQLCDSTASTWTGTILEQGRCVFQDFCPNSSYAHEVKGIVEKIKGAKFIGVKDDMVIVMYENGDA